MKRKRQIELLSELTESLVGDGADLFLCFVDLCDSTQYKQTCTENNSSDLQWIQRQLIFLQRTAKLIKEYQGVIVKTIGDEVFSYFDATTNPGNIIKCAVDIIQSFDNLKSFSKGKSKIDVKILLDFGQTYNGTILDSIPYDPIGSSVDRCARLKKVANNNEIVFSENFLSLIKNKNKISNFKKKYNYLEGVEDFKGFGSLKYYKIAIK